MNFQSDFDNINDYILAKLSYKLIKQYGGSNKEFADTFNPHSNKDIMGMEFIHDIGLMNVKGKQFFDLIENINN
jgi:hypothetical protein